MFTLEAIKAQQKINKINPPATFPEVFFKAFPDMKRNKAEERFAQYLSVMRDMLMPILKHIRDGELHFSTSQAFDRCGKFNYKKETYYVWSVFKDIYPIVIEGKKGSNLHPTQTGYERNTKVRIVDDRTLIRLVEDKPAKEAFEAIFGIQATFDGETPVDLHNLQNFIDRTQDEILTATGTAHKAKLQRNLYQALMVKKVARHTLAAFERPFLPIIKSPSPYGRTYYRGLNVQNVTKQVRSAMLGANFQYDMQAASYAVKLWLYGEIHGGDDKVQEKRLAIYTREYLRDKAAIRKRLATECFKDTGIAHETSLKAIKLALTAIGFGARASASSWMTPNGWQSSALTEIIMNKDARDRFLKDSWVKGFIAEQKQLEKEIIDTYKLSAEYDNVADMLKAENTNNGKVTNAGIMAYLYQQTETVLMDTAAKVVENSGIAIVARIHDAFVTTRKLSPQVIDEIYASWEMRDYFKLDCDEDKGWIPAAKVRALKQADVSVADHREEIAREEQRAQLIAFKRRQADIADDKTGAVVPIERQRIDIDALNRSMIREENYHWRKDD